MKGRTNFPSCLGALNPVEVAEFQAAMKLDPELKLFVARLSAAAGVLTGAVPVVEPPVRSRGNILAQIPP